MERKTATIHIRHQYRRKETMNKQIERGRVVKRQWKMLELLQTSQHTIADLASQFQMSTKNIRRDIVAMTAAGLPIGYDGRYVFAKDNNPNKENEPMTKSLEIHGKVRKQTIQCKYGCGQMLSP